MKSEDKFKEIARNDKSVAEHILSRAEEIDEEQLNALISLHYNVIMESQVQNFKWDRKEIIERFIKVSETKLTRNN